MSVETKPVQLFLDDYRTPSSVYGGEDSDWHIVRSYEEFDAFIKGRSKDDFPVLVSFDYQLGQRDYDGLSCAKALIRRCLNDREITFPVCHVHSTYGKGNETFEKFESVFWNYEVRTDIEVQCVQIGKGEEPEEKKAEPTKPTKLGKFDPYRWKRY